MEVLKIICGYLYFAILFLIFVVFPLMIVKINVAHRQRVRILHAIYNYQLDTDFYLVSYRDMEPFEKTANRFWDWGYTRILPKEKFEIIKPYLEVKKKMTALEFIGGIFGGIFTFLVAMFIFWR